MLTAVIHICSSASAVKQAMTKKIFVCTNYRANPNNPSCASRDSRLVLDLLKAEFAQKDIAIEIEESPCMGYCNAGPNVRLAPNGQFFHGVSTSNLVKLINAAKKFAAD